MRKIITIHITEDMFKMKTTIIALLIMSCITGCVSNKNLSMNTQRSLGRGLGDLSATLIIEKNKSITPEQVMTTANLIKGYIENEDMTKYTPEALRIQIEEQIPYAPLKNLAYKMVNQIPEGVEPEAAREVIIAICNGLIIGAEQYRYE